MLFISLCMLYTFAFGIAAYALYKIPAVRKVLNKLLED